MSLFFRSLLCVCAAWLATSSASAQDNFHGMCDASAAVGLGRGYFVVADDESDVLRIYQRGKPMPVGTLDLIDFLHNRKPNGEPTEADIEGAAQIGQRIYWISSHARKGKNGDIAPHRRRLFATDIVAGGPVPGLKAAGIPYESLLETLLADPRFAVLNKAAQRKPEDKDGLNIEGLAAAADGGLLIGLRNPLPQGRALLIHLRNPRALIDEGAKALFDAPIALDLGGRGIRSIERVGNEVLIVAGPYATAKKSKVSPAFALFRWSGVEKQVPVFVRALDAGSARPEAMFFDQETRELVLLSDDGDEKIGKAECKDKDVAPERKNFRWQSLPWR